MASAGTLDQRKTAYIALVAAGFNAADRKTFMRIASRESGFNPQAHKGPDSTDDSYGLWQINVLSSGQWAEVKGYGLGITDKPQLFDPLKNAKVAQRMNARYGLNPWNINGDPLRNTLSESQVMAGLDVAALETAGKMIGEGSDGGILDTVGGVVTGIPGAIGDVVGAVTPDWVESLGKLLRNLLNPQWWKRLGLGMLGVAVCVLAVVVWRRKEIAMAAGAAAGGPAGAMAAGGAMDAATGAAE